MAGTGGEAASYGDLLITSLVVLVGVSIAAFIVVKVLGRYLATGRVRGAHLLDVIARVPLEPRRSLYVVEVAGKTLLLGTSEMGLSVLSELDGGEVRARVVAQPTFGELVRSAWARRRGGAEPDGAGAGGARAGGARADGARAGGARAGGARADDAEADGAGAGGARADGTEPHGAELHVATPPDARARAALADRAAALSTTWDRREDA